MSTDELSRQGLGLEHSLGISLAVPRFAPLDDVDVERTDLRALCFDEVCKCHCAVQRCLPVSGGFRDVYDVVADGTCTVESNVEYIGDECSSECGERPLGRGSHDDCCPTLQRGPRAVPAVLLSARIPIAGWKKAVAVAAASPLRCSQPACHRFAYSDTARVKQEGIIIFVNNTIRTHHKPTLFYPRAALMIHAIVHTSSLRLITRLGLSKQRPSR